METTTERLEELREQNRKRAIEIEAHSKKNGLLLQDLIERSKRIEILLDLVTLRIITRIVEKALQG